MTGPAKPIRALLLDADGVVVNRPLPYSAIRAAELGKRPEDFLPFFDGPFNDALTGHADLADLVRAHHELWQWDRPFPELIATWCEAENYTNPQVMELIAQVRRQGIRVYLATNQEKHRTGYLRDVMLKGVFDGFLASCDLGALKTQNAFWERAYSRLVAEIPGITPEQIAYFDDNAENVAAAQLTGIRAQLYRGEAAEIALVVA